MVVGSVRKRMIIALLIYRFGKENFETDLLITEPGVEVKGLCELPEAYFSQCGK
jgi:hypothetical protein